MSYHTFGMMFFHDSVSGSVSGLSICLTWWASPFFGFFLQTFGGETLSHAKWIIPIAVAMSCYSGLNSSIIAASRYEI